MYNLINVFNNKMINYPINNLKFPLKENTVQSIAQKLRNNKNYKLNLK